MSFNWSFLIINDCPIWIQVIRHKYFWVTILLGGQMAFEEGRIIAEMSK